MEYDLDELWMDEDIFVKSRQRSRPKKTRSINLLVDDVDNTSKVVNRLHDLAISKSDQKLLAKLISNGHLKSVDKIVIRKKNSIILSGTICPKHFPTLESDAVIIKIPINGSKTELWQRSRAESHQNKCSSRGYNQPTFLLQSRHIMVTAMIGKDGVPAPTLIDVVNSKQRDIVKVYDEIIQYWCKMRNRPFHPSNLLYHRNRWWTVGYGGNGYETVNVHPCTQGLSFYRTNLKYIFDFFGENGLSMKQAECGFMRHARNYHWHITTDVVRGMTKKQLFCLITNNMGKYIE